ncbi:MAG: histidine kinase [Cellulosilyticaceae bacterium]
MDKWKMYYKEKLQHVWLALTLKKKIYFFSGIVFFIVFLSIMFEIWVVNFSVNDFRIILQDNARNIELMNAIETESNYFSEYIKNPSEEKYKELEDAFKRTRSVISHLPYEYTAIGDYRYAKTWSIHNSYETYEYKRDAILKMEEENPNYIKELYQVYNMQAFLQDYAKTLMTYTLEEGTAAYINKVPYLRVVPFVILLFGIFLLLGTMSLTRLMNKTIIWPIMDLVRVSKRIAANDFFVEDVKVENRDEMGELVEAFNRMKYETGQYIRTLEEKREMASLLHKEELEKLEVEKRLETIKLELLKNQINPHFLFNTLNVISGMANLEGAKTTDKMIKALSALFRYNLKMSEAEVVVAKELKVVKDYMYLQQMRFGSRIDYRIDCQVDSDVVKVPTCSFQPLVENAIIHGLSRKEEGGKIIIRIWEEGQDIMISVADTGVGMTVEKLEHLRNAFKQGVTEQMGIGLGNIYKRVQVMYPNGEVKVFSKKDIGTVVRLRIQQIEREA